MSTRPVFLLLASFALTLMMAGFGQAQTSVDCCNEVAGARDAVPTRGAGYIYNAPSYRVGWIVTNPVWDGGYAVGPSLVTNVAGRVPPYANAYSHSSYHVGGGRLVTGVSGASSTFSRTNTAGLAGYNWPVYQEPAAFGPNGATSRSAYRQTSLGVTYFPTSHPASYLASAPYGLVYGTYGNSAPSGY